MNFKAASDYITIKLQEELPVHLSYHSVEHIKDVYQAAETLGKAEGISREELDLVLTAALYHDAGFLSGPKDHEQKSCDIVRDALPNFGYTNEQIEKVCGMIMATKIPQSPNNLLEQILSDADLDYLGRDDFFTIGNKLFSELSVFGFINTEDEWNALQIRFLENHSYFTKTAIALRKAKKESHLELIRAKLNHSK